MIIFFDTSSLFKLYHKEDGTDALLDLFNSGKVEVVYLSEITKIEFDSTVWKKFRKHEIRIDFVKILIGNFEKDWTKYNFINSNSEIIYKARELLAKYGSEGLRTLDSIQLASALEVKPLTNLYITSDKLLLQLFKNEGLPVSEFYNI